MALITLKDGTKTIHYETEDDSSISEVIKSLELRHGLKDFYLTNNTYKVGNSELIKQFTNLNFEIVYKKNVCCFKRCINRGNKSLGFCNRCKYLFCGKHRIPESHSCKEIDSCRRDAMERNQIKLMSEKISGNKI